MTHHPRRPRFVVAGLAVVAALASACADPARPSLRIALAASPSAEVLELAKERGLFAAEGVDVRLVEHTSSGDVLRAFERGQTEGMLTSVVELLHASDEGARTPQVALVTDGAGAAGSVLTREPLATGAGLRGLRVAVEPRSLSFYVLLETLARNGLTLADVTVVQADAMSMPRLLADGSVDAVVGYPPWTQHILRRRAGHALGDVQPRSAALDVLAFDRDVARDRPRDVAAVLRAWDQALASLAADPQGSVALMAERERLTVREFSALLAEARLLRSDAQVPWLASGGALAEAVERVSRTLRDSGQMSRPSEDPLATDAAARPGAG